MKRPHWTKHVPTEPGLYWAHPCVSFSHAPYIVWNAGKEFSFIGTDAVMSPKEARTEGVEFWSERLEAPK
jgi:hypothetical protein